MHKAEAFSFPMVLCTFFWLLSLGCNKPEPIPAWVEVPGYDVVTEPGEGTAHHQLTEVYVYTPTSFLGAYPIPGRIPILEEGPVSIDLFPGIRANGIKASPDIYPFLGRVTTTVDLIPGATSIIEPVFTYDPLAKIRFVEDFEGSIKFLNNLLQGKAITLDSDAFEGNSAGLITVDTTNRIFEVSSGIFADIPQNGTPIYVEIHYRNEAPFLVGIMGDDLGFPNIRQYVVGLNPRNTWNKVYISLTDIINDTRLQNIRVIITASLPTSPAVDEAKIWIDNVKLVHQ